MFLKSLTLHNFRSYTKSDFSFSKDLTIVIGPNTSGKTNMLEAIYLLSHGKSLRADRESEAIRIGSEGAIVRGVVDDTVLEMRIHSGTLVGREAPVKKYLINDVPKRRVDFAGNLVVVFFSPADLDILIGSPGMRRRFFNDVLEPTDRGYRLALTLYEKGIRQRNALLEMVRETGISHAEQFRYWDELLIQNGDVITKTREDFVAFVNKAQKDIFPLTMEYDKSVISRQRLLQYHDAERRAGVTLVGPHRDDFFLTMPTKDAKQEIDVKLFGSRGQQRLAILQLKILQLEWIEKTLMLSPVLLLDDIFSELDQGHIQLVLDMIGRQQTILSTTHEEFVPLTLRKNSNLIELG